MRLKSKGIFNFDINWERVAELASKQYGKVVYPYYCRSVYTGQNHSQRLFDIITKIISTESKKIDNKINQKVPV
jgi:hypothetical protein